MVKSRLGQSLVRLEDNLAALRREEERAAVACSEWRERWRGHQRQIARRLELIESQLEEPVGDNSIAAPQLSVVGSMSDHQEVAAC